MINLPYTKAELTEACKRANAKLQTVSEETLHEDLKYFFVLNEDKKLFNSALADYNGITVFEVLNSSNYLIFKEEFIDYNIKKIVMLLQKKYNLTKVEAWGYYYCSK